RIERMNTPQPIRVFVPSDTSARSVGADAVADAITREAQRRGQPLEVIRNGSRGLYWPDPPVAVECHGERIGYGPATADDVAGLFDAALLTGGEHPKRLGPTEAIPYLARQTRLTFARVGVTDPLSLDDYRRHGGFVGLENALRMSGSAIVAAVT